MTAEDPAAAARRLAVELPLTRRGERLDHALAAMLPEQSRAALQRLMREGRVRLAGSAARPSYRVRGGEEVEIILPLPRPSALVAEAIPLDVLHEDEDLLVLNKAPGVTVHPGAGARGGTLVHALLHHCRDLSGIGGIERPGIVHRLDRDTSGALVVAKNDAAHRSLAAQFKARSIKKVYEALVWGRPGRSAGVIDAPVGRHPVARVKMAVRSDGRAARSAYRLAGRFGPVSLLELEPETGRTHQLRVHLMSLGHPVVGDRIYGGRRAAQPRDNARQRAIAQFGGLALHARTLGFVHPRSGDWCEFTAPRPAELERLLATLRASGTDEGGRGGGPT